MGKCLDKALVRIRQGGSLGEVPQPSLPPRKPSGDLSQQVRVKNTFLDLDDRQRSCLPRSSTAPAGRGAREDSDEEEPDVDEPDVVEPSSPRGLANLEQYRTMTVVDYEQTSSWGWVDGEGAIQGDPNAPLHGPPGAPMVAEAPPVEAAAGVYVPVGFVPAPNSYIRWADEDPSLALAPPAAPVPVPRPERGEIMQRAFSCTSQVYRIRWTVDSRKLKSADREAASPIFELSFAGPVEFRMILKPRAVHDSKGGASFKKAQGWGSIELKCLCDVDMLTNP